jgi:hypothetical protein
MNTKLTRRAVLGTVIGGLAVAPFAMWHFRRTTPQWEMSEDIVLLEDLVREPRIQFFEEWKALRKPFLAKPKIVHNAPDKIVLRPDVSKPLKWHFRILGTSIQGNWTSLDDFAANGENAEKAFGYTIIEGSLTTEGGKLFVDVAKNERKMVLTTTNSEGKSPMITTRGGGGGIVVAIDGKPVSAKNKHEFFLNRIDTQQLATDRLEYGVIPENKPPVVNVVSREESADGVTRTTIHSRSSSNNRAGLLTALTKLDGLPRESIVLYSTLNKVLTNPYFGEYPMNTVIQLPNRGLFPPGSAELVNVRIGSVKELNKIRSVEFSYSGKVRVGISTSGASAVPRDVSANVVHDKVQRMCMDNGHACYCLDRIAPPDDLVDAFAQFTEFICSTDEV